MGKELTELQQLLIKYLDNTISPVELRAFWNLVAAAAEDDPIHNDLSELWRQTGGSMDHLNDQYDYAAALQSIKARAEQVEGATVVSLRRKWGWVAAALVVLFGSAGAFLLQSRQAEESVPAHTTSPIRDMSHCNDCATLTLADGTVIELDKAASGNLAEQGTTQILKLEAGQLAYKSEKNVNGVVTYNTINTPRGGTYQIILPDGSKVWLNAASSIKFPTTFPVDERRVEVRGEAFFEVKPNQKAPFKVFLDKCEIQVLGTSFNVNGYAEEDEIKTTLLEGSVQLKVNKRSQLLKPGQQVAYHTDMQTMQISAANIEEVMSWKEGFFYFDNANIPTIMRQIARWYNVEVIYEGKIPTRGFKGEIGRDLSLREVVGFLKQLKVNVEMVEDKLVVKA